MSGILPYYHMTVTVSHMCVTIIQLHNWTCSYCPIEDKDAEILAKWCFHKKNTKLQTLKLTGKLSH